MSSSQGNGYVARELQMRVDHGKLSLRGPANPHSRSFRFNSPGHGGSRRCAPGSTVAVPGSPRASPRRERPDDSQDSSPLRGMPPGRVVEAYRTRQAPTPAWPHRRGESSVPSQTASPRCTSPAHSRQASPKSAAPRSPRASPRVAFAPVVDAVTEAMAAAEFKPDVHGPTEMRRRYDEMQSSSMFITEADASALAAAAAAQAEAEAEAEASARSAPPKHTEDPIYANNPWRVGISTRTKERGASRIFPLPLAAPHMSGGGVRPASPRSMSPRRLVRDDDMGIQRLDLRGERLNMRIVPSGSASVCSTVSRRMHAMSDVSSEASGTPLTSPRDSRFGARESALRRPATQAPLLEGELPSESSHAQPSMLQRAPASAALHPAKDMAPSSNMSSAGDLDVSRLSSSASSLAVAATTSSASKRLTALRSKLEQSLRSAEAGLQADMKQLDKRLSSKSRP